MAPSRRLGELELLEDRARLGRPRGLALLPEPREPRAQVADPVVGVEDAADDELRRNQQLIWRWDRLSLALCLEWEIRPDELEPWPFARDEVDLRCEGRRLEGRYDDERALHAALEAAPRVELRFQLTPSDAGGRAA